MKIAPFSFSVNELASGSLQMTLRQQGRKPVSSVCEDHVWSSVFNQFVKTANSNIRHLANCWTSLSGKNLTSRARRAQ